MKAALKALSRVNAKDLQHRNTIKARMGNRIFDRRVSASGGKDC